MAADQNAISAEVSFNIDEITNAVNDTQSASEKIVEAMERSGTAVEHTQGHIKNLSEVLEGKLTEAATTASEKLGDLATKALKLDKSSDFGKFVATGIAEAVDALASSFGAYGKIVEIALAVGFGLYDYASGAKAAREALEDLGVVAEKWKSTQATTIYDTGTMDPLARFGLSKLNFGAVTSSENWLQELQKVWLDGKEGTDEVIQQFEDSFVADSDRVRSRIESRGALLESLGILDDETRAQMEQDLADLDAYDQSVKEMLQNHQTGEKLEGIIERRAELEVTYGVGDTGGFDRIMEGMQAELDRTQAMGAEADAALYGDTLNALAQGRQAYIDSINRVYDAQHAQLMTIGDDGQREAALEALNNQYSEQRQQIDQAYNEAMQQAAKQAWETSGFEEQYKQIRDLAELLGDGTLTPNDAYDWTKSVDEGKLASMFALIEQMKASGMSDNQLKELGIDTNELYAMLLQIRDTSAEIGENGGRELHDMIATALPEEIQRIMIGLDMTEAAADWKAFMEGKDPFNVNANVNLEKGENISLPFSMRLNFMDQAAIKKWTRENIDMELSGSMKKVGVVLESGWLDKVEEARGKDKLAVYGSDGKRLAITPEVMEQIDATDLAAYDSDGTLHILLTPDLGSPEAAEAALDKLGPRSGIEGWFPGSTKNKVSGIIEKSRELDELNSKIDKLKKEGKEWDEYGWHLDWLEQDFDQSKSDLEAYLESLSKNDFENIASGIMTLGAALASGTLDDSTAAQYREELENLLAVWRDAERYFADSGIGDSIANAMKIYGWEGGVSSFIDLVNDSLMGAGKKPIDIQCPVSATPEFQSFTPMNASGFDGMLTTLDSRVGSQMGTRPMPLNVPVILNPMFQPVAPMQPDGWNAMPASEDIQPLPITIPVAVNLLPETVTLADDTGLVAILTAAGETAAQGYGTGMAMTDMSPYALAFSASTLTAIQMAGTGFDLAGSALGANYVNGIALGMQDTSSIAVAMEMLRFAIINPFMTLGLDASLMGMQLPLSYAMGITMGSEIVALSTSGMVLSAISAAQGNTNGAFNLGKMISAGVASGISAGQSGVVNAAVAMVKAAINAANSTAEIGSPSKVTTEMGKFWDQGWARGIRNNTRIVTDAASGMVTQAIRTVDGFEGAITPDIEGAIRSAVYVEPPAGAAYGAAQEAAPIVRVTGTPIDYDALADAMNQRQMALYLTDRRMAQVMATETARAQSARSRSIALGYGK